MTPEATWILEKISLDSVKQVLQSFAEEKVFKTMEEKVREDDAFNAEFDRLSSKLHALVGHLVQNLGFDIDNTLVDGRGISGQRAPMFRLNMPNSVGWVVIELAMAKGQLGIVLRSGYVEPPHRRQGHLTNYLNAVCQFADESNVPLFLTPQPFSIRASRDDLAEGVIDRDAPSGKVLCELYKRWGFVPFNFTTTIELRREPRFVN